MLSGAPRRRPEGPARGRGQHGIVCSVERARQGARWARKIRIACVEVEVTSGPKVEVLLRREAQRPRGSPCAPPACTRALSICAACQRALTCRADGQSASTRGRRTRRAAGALRLPSQQNFNFWPAGDFYLNTCYSNFPRPPRPLARPLDAANNAVLAASTGGALRATARRTAEHARALVSAGRAAAALVATHGRQTVVYAAALVPWNPRLLTDAARAVAAAVAAASRALVRYLLSMLRWLVQATARQSELVMDLSRGVRASAADKAVYMVDFYQRGGVLSRVKSAASTTAGATVRAVGSVARSARQAADYSRFALSNAASSSTSASSSVRKVVTSSTPRIVTSSTAGVTTSARTVKATTASARRGAATAGLAKDKLIRPSERMGAAKAALKEARAGTRRS